MNRRLEDAAPAELYDDALRWIIPSDSDPHGSHVVELDSFNGNGECTCEDFNMRFRPLLSRRVTPEQALQAGLVKQRTNQRAEDVLRCKHIISAQKQFACAAIKSLSKAKKASEKQAREHVYNLPPRYA